MLKSSATGQEPGVGAVLGDGAGAACRPGGIRPWILRRYQAET
jgi:hypothetical protein